MLSLRPLVGPQFGDVLDVFDGGRADAVRYDATVQGFLFSASWGNADLIDNGDVYDVAVRYATEAGGLKLAAGVGYRQGVVVPTIGAVQDVKVLSGSASAMHVATGLFATGAYGSFKGEGPLAWLPDLKGWQGQAGLEERWNKFGKTTVFAEYGVLELDGTAVKPKLMGVGLVQNFEAAALDVYLDWRRYDLDVGADAEIDVVLGGARVKF
jgi:hypothetical protein